MVFKGLNKSAENELKKIIDSPGGLPLIKTTKSESELSLTRRPINATWSISLDCNCPECKEDIDLLDGPDFWEMHDFEIGEHETKRTQNVEVICPNCEHEFSVNLSY
ncbi:MAG: hypothetical protein GY841_15575 [FCB group bacterium]|nr:hypothetical protein [FCB group bacterium]